MEAVSLLKQFQPHWSALKRSQTSSLSNPWWLRSTHPDFRAEETTQDLSCRCKPWAERMEKSALRVCLQASLASPTGSPQSLRGAPGGKSHI